MAKKQQKSKYETPPRVKSGRCWYVKGYDGKPIVGLSWDKGNGYYFPTHYKDTEEFQKTGKRLNFSKDYDNAIMLFRQWRGKEAFTKIQVADGDIQVKSTATRKRSAKEIAMLKELSEGLSEKEKKDLGIGIENGISETSTCDIREAFTKTKTVDFRVDFCFQNLRFYYRQWGWRLFRIPPPPFDSLRSLMAGHCYQLCLDG